MNLSGRYTQVCCRQASVVTLMYHGTAAANLSSILSQGLIPNPKKRAWADDPSSSFQNPSRASLSGIYLTTNLMTALSSGNQGPSFGSALIIVSVQSGNLLADEDDIKFRLNSNITSHEYSVTGLYVAWKALEGDRYTHDFRRSEALEELTQAQQTFVENSLRDINYRMNQTLNQHEMNLLLPALQKSFFVVLTRKAAYVDKFSWPSERWDYEIPLPDKAQAEVEFKKMEDRLTRLLKRLGRPEHINPAAFNPTARIETPIRYSGRNKIVAVVEILPYQTGRGGSSVRVRYPSSGQVPGKFIADWNQAVGSWEEAVARGHAVGSVESPFTSEVRT